MWVIKLARSVYRVFRRIAKKTLVRMGLLDDSPFARLEKNINKETWRKHEEVLRWADRLVNQSGSGLGQDYSFHANDELWQKALLLRENCLEQFKNKFKDNSSLRVLVHVPSAIDSPGGSSLFNNLVEALNYIGVDASVLPWQHENLSEILDRIRPTVFLTSDHESYLTRVDWPAVARYQNTNVLKVGLTASLEEYGNSPLDSRLSWAAKSSVDFYYSFRAQEYLREREAYRPFFDHGYHIHSVEFGANVLRYYPVPNIEKDLDYVFLGSSNPDKWPRYSSFFGNILKERVGFINGPGWQNIKEFRLDPDRDRFIYARAKVGLNLHLDEQIKWANELNERTYMLAACGVPQLIDRPKLLPERFRLDGMFVADSAKEYEDQFDYALNHPHEAQKRALIAMEDVYAQHTTFHRAEQFAKALLCEVVK